MFSTCLSQISPGKIGGCCKFRLIPKFLSDRAALCDGITGWIPRLEVAPLTLRLSYAPSPHKETILPSMRSKVSETTDASSWLSEVISAATICWVLTSTAMCGVYAKFSVCPFRVWKPFIRLRRTPSTQFCRLQRREDRDCRILWMF